MGNHTEKLFLKSQKLFKEGKLDQAIEILKTIIAEDPTYLKAYYSLAYVFMERNKNAEAEHILLKVIELSPDWHIAHLQLGKAYENQKKWEHALTSYQRAVNLDPENVYARMHLGIMYHKLGNLEAGVNELQIAYQAGLEDFEVIYNLANGLQGLKRLTEALEVIDKALENLDFDNCDLAQLYYLRGNIYLYLKRFDEAYTSLEKAIEVVPTDPQVLVSLGEVCFEKGQLEAAIDWYKQALTSETNKGEAYRGIGYSYLSLEDWESSVSNLEKARELGVDVFFGLGVAYFELGNDEKGIEYLKNEILNDGSAKTQASYYLGFAYTTVGENKLSIEAFNQFLELSKRDTNKSRWEEWRVEAKRKVEELSMS